MGWWHGIPTGFEQAVLNFSDAMKSGTQVPFSSSSLDGFKPAIPLRTDRQLFEKGKLKVQFEKEAMIL